MAGWAERLDQFLGSYPHLIAALEAVSTFAAVLVSLSLAVWSQRANRTQIKAVATISVICILV
jgi:hypothetical protein